MGDSEKNVPIQESKQPLLFISHKHDDTKIAEEIAKFVRHVSGGGVDVFLSSNPRFEGPRVGKELNVQLKEALWRAGVVILVYTSQDKDWSWCMWECGLAEDRQSPDTKVVVLQCLSDKPEVFKGTVSVLAWDQENIEKFVNRFRDEDFFPGLGKAVTGLSQPELIEAAKDLHENLINAIPREPPENWDAWPFLRIQLAREVVDELKATASEERVAKTRDELIEKATVVLSSSGSSQLFGRAGLPSVMGFGELVKEWSENYPGRSIGWLDVIARQVIYGAQRRTLDVVDWERFRHVNSDAESVPVVGRIKSDAVAMQFDIYFYGVAHVPSVTSRMIRLDKMYHLDLAKKAAKEVRLRELLNHLEEREWNRIPVLESRRPKYIVHMSMIDRFLRKRSYAKQDVAEFTFEDVLREEAIEKMFAESWDVVPEGATVDDAWKVMRARTHCEDLFVTEGGGRDEPVLGWLTDRDITDQQF